LLRVTGERVLGVVLAASAVVAGVRVAQLGLPSFAVTAAVAVAAVVVVRSGRVATAVLLTALGAAVAGCAVAVRVHGADVWDAVLTVGALAAVAVVVVGVRRTLQAQADDALAARRAADALRVNDGLTGVLNRRGLELMADPMIELSRRRGEAVHALFVDVDGFALVNDELGYDRGDDVLVAVAEALVGSCRQTDVVCRVGGDEFVVLGPGTGTSPLELERRMREILRAAPPVEESVWPARLSIGSATLVPWDDGDLSSLLGRADSDMRLRRSLRRQSQDRRGARIGDISPREA
jgi:diguanylate cyclase (GGDEF)-like protein